MRMAIVHTSLLLSLAALAGCVGPQEEGPPPECPASRYHQVQRAAEPVPDKGRDLGGVWVGQACQSDGPCWTVQIALAWDERAQPIGNIAYPSVPCKARLEFVRWEPGGVAAFRERFDDPGKCVPDGWLRLSTVDDDSLNFVWAYPNGRVDVGTTLDRVR